MQFIRVILSVCIFAFTSECLTNPMRFWKRSSILKMSSSEQEKKYFKNPESVSDVAKEVIEKQFKIGKSIKWGVLQEDVKNEDIPDESTRSMLRKVAEKDLVNIDSSERSRRTLVGKVSGAIAVVSYIGSLYFGLETLPRAAITYLPVALSVGFLESGKQGL